MKKKTLTMLAVGDVILELPQPESYFSLVAPTLRAGDVVVGQGETPFTSRGVTTYVSMFASALGSPPAYLSAFASAGFNVVTLAGNHSFDQGPSGVEDTITGLRNHGIATVGTGMNIDEARRPAVIERDGTRFGFLDYNCAGPIGSWATFVKPGCAFVNIITHYENILPNPGDDPLIYSFAEPLSLNVMVEDIKKLRPLCDVLVVCFHKGILVVPVRLAMYEQQVSYAAIDAGADLVLGHHSHILRGIEQYKGKFIFHGLGHFVYARRPLSEEDIKSRELIGMPARNMWLPPYTSENIKAVMEERHQTIIAKFTIDEGRISRASYLPCKPNEQMQPEILKNDGRGKQVFDYMDRITREAGLNARYEWEGDEVVVRA